MYDEKLYAKSISIADRLLENNPGHPGKHLDFNCSVWLTETYTELFVVQRRKPSVRWRCQGLAR